jgi:hypothetical protein
MIHYLDFNGEQRPVLFGNAANYMYEMQVLPGRSAIQDFFQSATVNADGTIDHTTIKVSFYVNMAYAAFLAGASKTKTPFPYDALDISEWLNEKNMEIVANLFAGGLPVADKNAEEGGNEEPGETKQKQTTGKR